MMQKMFFGGTPCTANRKTSWITLSFSKLNCKDDVKSFLRIGSAHNKGGPADINIAQISHLSNYSDIKLWFIFIYENRKLVQNK